MMVSEPCPIPLAGEGQGSDYPSYFPIQKNNNIFTANR